LPSNGYFLPGTVWSVTATAGYQGTVTIGIVVYIDPSSGSNPSSLRVYRADFAIGDVNFDGEVDSADTIVINKAYGAIPGSSLWNSVYDLNNDGVIDSLDVTICTHHYGETTTSWTELPYLGYTQIGSTSYYVIYASTDHFSGFGIR